MKLRALLVGGNFVLSFGVVTAQRATVCAVVFFHFGGTCKRCDREQRGTASLSRSIASRNSRNDKNTHARLRISSNKRSVHTVYTRPPPDAHILERFVAQFHPSSISIHAVHVIGCMDVAETADTMIRWAPGTRLSTRRETVVPTIVSSPLRGASTVCVAQRLARAQ